MSAFYSAIDFTYLERGLFNAPFAFFRLRIVKFFSYFFFLFFSGQAIAIIERNVSVDFGFGTPQLVFAEAQAKISEHWQGGLGYSVSGFVPIPAYLLPSTTVLNTGPAGNLNFTPNVQPSLSGLTPFIRYFPSENNFYFQFAVHLLQLSGKVTGVLTSSDPLIPLAVNLTGNVSVLQTIPTISIGNIFAGKVYYINVSLGISFFSMAFADASIDGSIPDALGGQALMTQVATQLSTQMQTQVNTITALLKNQYPILPSINITLGWMF